jgi:phosphoribosylglycinamide formyltransferase-1
MEKDLGPERMSRKHTIAIFASGTGSNAQRIIEYFRDNNTAGRPEIDVGLIVCNNPAAGVASIAREFGIPLLLIDKKRFLEGDAYPEDLSPGKYDLLVLAGFLWKIPGPLLRAFEGRIINIHPALLPRFGGKGMYGRHVHHAVIEAGEKKSGISIHEVDEHYDHGRLLFQAECDVVAGETPESLAEKIHQLEHLHYAPAIRDFLLGLSGRA